MNKDNQMRLAVLIDADNAQPGIARHLLDEISKYGTAFVKRAYGDWTGTQLSGWKATLLDMSIQPIQQFSYTKGKNATDSALIIDAMDLLYTNRFDGFCIVSSDSDFTRLAARLREAGLLVYGFGEKKTPAPFVAACDKFIYTEVLLGGTDKEQPSKRRTPTQLKQDTKLINLLRSTIEDASDDEGWAGLGAVGSTATKKNPDFDSRNWGYAKLSDLVRASGLFDMEKRGAGQTIYVRNQHKAVKETNKPDV